MAGRFEEGGRVYIDTPAGHLLAARDRVADLARLRGHQMMHWGKEIHAGPVPFFRAYYGTCGAGVKVVAGRPPMNLPGYPSCLNRHRVRWCPGKQQRRRS